MISPEKNDVDISRLFNWNTKATIYGVDGIDTIELYIRIVGDADWNRARVKAMRASAELRKKLNDPDADEHLAYVPDKDNVDKDSLIHMMLILEMPDLRDQIIRDINIPFPKEPKDNASLEEMDKHQEEVDGFDIRGVYD